MVEHILDRQIRAKSRLMHGSNGVFNLITLRGVQQADPAKVNLQTNLIIARLIIIIVQFT